ncbi:hypothetical protein [Niabella sp.]|uniref:hypothetical protein n=1 Tax=Niabella sp. TaxID=1962976 RepID=UPI002628520E|nr:hypothetical protein [Niabella sp.]
MKTITTIAVCFICACLAGACSGSKKEALPPRPEPQPDTIKTEWNIPVTYLSPVTVDLDKDGENDFRIAIALEYIEGRTRARFKLTALGTAKTGNERNETPVLWGGGQKAAIQETDGFKWQPGNSVLIEMLVASSTEPPVWQGAFNNQHRKSVAVRITKNNRFYYGYLLFSGETAPGTAGLLLHSGFVVATPDIVLPAD